MATPRGREILEVFTVDERSAFGGAEGSTATAPTPAPADRATSSRRRWIVAAAVGTTAVVAVVAVVSADDDTDRAATSTTAPPTSTSTTVATTSIDATVLPVLSDAPPGYQLAEMDRPTTHDTTKGVSELWASAGATANNGGTWFLITAQQTHDGRNWVVGDRRMRLGEGSAVFAAPSLDDNVLPSLSTTTDEAFLTITGNVDPYLMAEVLGGASTVDTEGDGDPDELAFERMSFASELHVEARVGSEDGGAHPLYDSIDSTVIFSPPDRWDGLISLTAERHRSPERQRLVDFLLDERITLGAGAIEAAYGPLPFGGRQLTFELAGIAVTVSSQFASEESLMSVAEHVRIATDEAWADASGHVRPPDGGASAAPTHTEVASGTLDGTAWVAVVRGPMADGSMLFHLMRDSTGTATAMVGPADQPSIEVAAWADATFVLAHAPRTDAGALLRLTIGLDAPIELPLTDVDDVLPWLVTAVPFSDLRLWTAEIIDADGNVLASATSDIDSLMVAA